MLRTIIISPNQKLTERLEQSLEVLSANVAVIRTISQYPAAEDLVRTLKAQAPDAVFLSFEDPERALGVVKFLERQGTGVQVIGMHTALDATLLRDTMRVGVREFLIDPFEVSALAEACGNVRSHLANSPATYTATEEVFAFLPSKAGAGTTTLAVNTAAAIARQLPEGSGQRAILADLDLNSGMLRFVLNLKNPNSISDVIAQANTLDEEVWPELVTAFGLLDVLHAGRVNPNIRIDPNDMLALLEFLQRNYAAVCVDLSGNMERYSLAVMERAKNILLVCTPEIPSLHLAREKLNFLQGLGLDTRTRLVLNRMTRRPVFSAKQVEEVVGLPVIHTFPNDYYAVSQATAEGKMLAADSAIGQSCDDFAAALMSDIDRPREPKKKFLQYFSVNSPDQVGAGN